MKTPAGAQRCRERWAEAGSAYLDGIARSEEDGRLVSQARAVQCHCFTLQNTTTAGGHGDSHARGRLGAVCQIGVLLGGCRHALA